MSKINTFIKNIIKKRAKIIIDQFDDYIEPKTTYLSVGDGDGHVTAYLQDRCDVKGRGVDVDVTMPIRTIKVPLDCYDGKKLPYEDNSFDSVSAIFVLHHCDDVNQVLEEMIRVSRKKVIIIEDIYRNWLEYKIVCFFDYIENRSVSKDMNIPFNFKKVSEWEKLFKEKRLVIKKSKGFTIFKIIPVRHHVFCLDIS